MSTKTLTNKSKNNFRKSVDFPSLDKEYTEMSLCETHDLENEDGNNALFRFNDKMYCQHFIYNKVKINLLNNHKTILVLSKNEDLEFFQKRLSKDGLSHLAFIMDPSSNGFDNSKAPTSNIYTLNRESENDYNKLVEEFVENTENLLSFNSKIRKPLLGGLSILEIFERVKIKSPNHKKLDANLYTLFPFEKFKEKKVLIKACQEKYKNTFALLESTSPLELDKLNQYSVPDIQAFIRDEIFNFEEFITAFGKKAHHYTTHIRKMYNDKKRAAHQILFEFESLIEHNLTKSNISEKFQLKLDLLQDQIGAFPMESTYAETVENAKDAYRSYMKKVHEQEMIITEQYLNKLTVHSVDDDCAQLMTKADDMIAVVEESKLLKSRISKPVFSVGAYMSELKDILISLRSLSSFIEEYSEFLNWYGYFKNLPMPDQQLVSLFKDITSDWAECFEYNYLIGLIDNQMLSINDGNQLVDRNKDLVEGMDNTLLSSVKLAYTLNENDPLAFYEVKDWDTLFMRYSEEFITSFPLLILSGPSYENHIHALNVHIDEVIFTNYIPHIIPQSNWTQSTLVGYNETFLADSVEYVKKIDDCELTNVEETYININKSIHDMNISELNVFSLIIGNRLKDINPDVRLFQTKRYSFISFLTKDKNAELISHLRDYGIKEIFSDQKGHNLLPGAIAQSYDKIIVFIEDGMLNPNTDLFDVKSWELLNDLQKSKIKVVNINNYKWLTEHKYTMPIIIEQAISELK